MIARVWKGAVRPEDSDAYAAYIRDTGFNEYAQTAGNLGAWMIRRHRDGVTEFVTFSLRESMEAVKAFAADRDGDLAYETGPGTPSSSSASSSRTRPASSS